MWLKTAFSESDGKGSFTRMMTFIWIVALIGWDTFKIKGLPDATMIIAQIGSASTLYGLNIIKNVVQKNGAS